MRKFVAVLMAAGVMAGVGMITTTSAEAHWRHRGCCTYLKNVRYYKPVDRIEKRVYNERVFGWRTVHSKRLYRDWCRGRKHYRTVRYTEPVLKVVPKVRYVRVRSYKTYVVTKRFVRRCCCRSWL